MNMDDSHSANMATVTLTSTGVKPLQTRDIATRLLNGTLHSQWPAFEQFETIDGLLKSHAAQPDEGKYPLICYPIRAAADFEEHTAGDIDRYTDVAVRFYMQQGLTAAVSAVPVSMSNETANIFIGPESRASPCHCHSCGI